MHGLIKATLINFMEILAAWMESLAPPGKLKILYE